MIKLQISKMLSLRKENSLSNFDKKQIKGIRNLIIMIRKLIISNSLSILLFHVRLAIYVGFELI